MIDINNLPTVTIGCPISNRSYLINRFLTAITKLDYPKDKIKLYFLINNCNDGTDQDLKKFQDKNKKDYMDIILEKYKMPYRQDKRVSGHRLETYRRLAELRNYVLSRIDTEYFFSVDSDVMVFPNVLIELIKADKDIIAATINNDRILRPYSDHPKIRTNLLNQYNFGINHYMDFPLNEIVPVDITGAVYLMKRKVCQTVLYEYSEMGEDIPFCINAKELGYGIYAHTGLWQEHIMCEYQQYCIDNKCQNPCVIIDATTKVYQYRYKDNVVYPILGRCAKLKTGDKALLVN